MSLMHRKNISKGLILVKCYHELSNVSSSECGEIKEECRKPRIIFLECRWTSLPRRRDELCAEIVAVSLAGESLSSQVLSKYQLSYERMNTKLNTITQVDYSLNQITCCWKHSYYDAAIVVLWDSDPLDRCHIPEEQIHTALFFVAI